MPGKFRKFARTLCVAWTTGAAALSALPVHAEAGSVQDRDRIIDRAIIAHGGERLAAMTSIITEWVLDDAQIFQSRRPEPPWDVTRRWEAYAVDFEARSYADARYDGGSGYEWMTGTILDDTRVLRLDYRNRTYRTLSVDFDEAVADAMTWSPLVALRWLSDHRERTTYAGQRRDDDTVVEVLSVSRESGADIEVWFDSDSGRVHGLEAGYTDFDGGHVPLYFRYSDWRDFDGFHYPAHVEMRAHGYVARRASLAHMDMGGSLGGYLKVPDGFAATANEAPDIRAFRVEKIADGIYFVGEGVMYQLFVEFDDFLVALDSSSGDVERRIDALRERVPDKPFKYVLASHHHDDHLHGLDEFVALGATVIAAPTHVDTVKKYVADTLEHTAEVITVADELIIANGNRKLRVLEIGPTPHSDEMLAAYLPGENILFAADLYVLGGRRQPVIPAMANGLALIEQIGAHGLNVERMVDPHSPLIATLSDLTQSADELRGSSEGVMTRARADLVIWRSADQYVPADRYTRSSPTLNTDDP